jgi:membrane protease YdiL (CAAX protease family)
MVRGEWARVWNFLKHPVLPPRAELSPGGTLRMLGPLLLLDVALMVVLIGGVGIAAGLGFEMPDHLLADMALTPAIIAALVLAAPIGEEIVFRGWVSGRPGHVLAVLLLLVAVAAVVFGRENMAMLAVALIAPVLALAALFLLRRRDAMGWFAKAFPVLFYVSAAIFALVHLTNYANSGMATALLVPLVVPQFVLGLLLAYIRVQRGLWSSMLLHVLHNTLFVGLMLVGSSAA